MWITKSIIFRNSTPPITSVEGLKAKTALARGKLHVDVAFWGGLVPGNINEIWGLIRAGVVGIKCFLYPSGDDDFPEVNLEDVTAALKKIEGTGSILAVSCHLNSHNNVLYMETYFI